MRKTIRRGLFVTATAGFALLGFGLAQASAAVPALPSVPSAPSLPTLPGLGGLPGLDGLGDLAMLDGLTSFGTLSNRSGLPTTDGLPGLDSLGGLSLLDGLTDFGDLTDMASMPELSGIEGVPAAGDLPTDSLGLPGAGVGELPVGFDSAQLPTLPTVPTEASEITKAPVVQLPATDKLPLVAQVEHNDLAHKVIPSTDGVNVQGLPKPQVPDVAAAPGAVKLPSAAPVQKPGMQGVGVPTELPVLSGVDTTMPSLDDLTGGTDLPTDLPTLPAV